MKNKTAKLWALLLTGIICTGLAAAEVKIVKAVYGTGDQINDVTEIVTKKAIGLPGVFMVITPSNQLFGADPAPKKPKELTLTYSENGTEKSISGKERNTMAILFGAEAAADFKILKAFYGAEASWNDVTTKVTEVVENKASLTVNNTTFSPDPMRGKAKTLAVFYTMNNEIKYVAIPETKQLAPSSFPVK